MGSKSHTERRWLRSVIAASAEPLPNFPWMRGQRRKPASLTPAPKAPAKVTAFSRPTYGAAIAAR